ncbi:AraC family transcriptional regulator [Azospirillum picis]|uniref:DNA gyrase inhibitor GyrI n=1 Tax=Azospirillum picis TaxID=488438 RepID=A0ABU0MJY3_9PROT|nr:GyrI-like domain-containing protein [Azospirillum picis]MBP2299994.1 DNA gyrase inhibitor GyrI [Azospirillum picis]MDQ0533768.1 DNA gyrase inhibitor GyrI [Azospirillum picis]
MHDVTIGERPDVRLTGFEHRGPYHGIGATFDRLAAWAAPRGLLGSGARCFGVYYGNPNLVAPEDLRAFAGLVLPTPVPLPAKPQPAEPPQDDAETIDVPGGPCAVLVHQGDYRELEGVHRWLYGTWFPGSGHRPDPGRPCCEEYLNDPRSLPPADWLTRITAPLR